jgi:hypothetical protein
MPSETESGSLASSGTQDPYKMVDPNGLDTTADGSGTSATATDSEPSTSGDAGQT